MNRKSRQSAPPSIAALLPQNRELVFPSLFLSQYLKILLSFVMYLSVKAMTMMPLTEGEYEDEDDLSEPPADDDILEPPPEEDEPGKLETKMELAVELFLF